MSAIRFEDVRVGDRVRVTKRPYTSGTVTTYEGVAGHSEFGDYLVLGERADGRDVTVFRDYIASITLLDRPAECGDIRVDPQTGARYIRTNDNHRAWVCFACGAVGLCLFTKTDHDTIARLVPVEVTS